MHQPSIICFGEVLWDLLPSGKIAGGAPMNVAYQANQLGMTSKMISRVGMDALGEELLHFLDGKGVSTRFVQKDPVHATGIVNGTLNNQGVPTYEIVQPAAWDFITPDGELHDTVMEADALVFGSLACRSNSTKTTLIELLNIATLRVFDVNLRQPFYSKNLLEELLPKADIVKLNDDELAIISAWYGTAGTEADQMKFLRDKYQLDVLILTKGANGAACLDETGFHSHPGFIVNVDDTIGSGDAFLAAFLNKLLTGSESAECLEFASALGALTATKKGGTPTITQLEIQDFLLHQVHLNS